MTAKWRCRRLLFCKLLRDDDTAAAAAIPCLALISRHFRYSSVQLQHRYQASTRERSFACSYAAFISAKATCALEFCVPRALGRAVHLLSRRGLFSRSGGAPRPPKARQCWGHVRARARRNVASFGRKEMRARLGDRVAVVGLP